MLRRGRVLGNEHSLTLVTMINLALLYDLEGRGEAAEPLFQKEMSIPLHKKITQLATEYYSTGGQRDPKQRVPQIVRDNGHHVCLVAQPPCEDVCIPTSPSSSTGPRR